MEHERIEQRSTQTQSHTLTVSPASRFCFSLITYPAAEKRCSDGTDVAGIPRKSLAIFVRLGNSREWSHHQSRILLSSETGGIDKYLSYMQWTKVSLYYMCIKQQLHYSPFQFILLLRQTNLLVSENPLKNAS